jgi:magnesium-transporting ATPase (P-type)
VTILARIHQRDRTLMLDSTTLCSSDEGKTAILAAINNKVCVVMGVADEIKPDAATSIAYLQEKLGVEVWMVTGDNPRTAHAVGQHLGIPSHRVISEALPAAKVQHVQRMQGEGRVVCFVGDGINDSPALAQADVGLSVGTGTEIAAEASDMVLVAGNVSDVCTALDLSRAIFRRIQWNFVWSLMYNCLGIPIAAGALYPLTHIRLPPPVAAIAMALSSISVVLSSMALRLYRPPDLNSGRSQQRRSSSTTAATLWARMVRRQQRPASSRRSRRQHRPSSGSNAIDDDDMNASLSEALLESDHLMSSSSVGDATESTRCIDNRTASRLEAGTLRRVD